MRNRVGRWLLLLGALGFAIVGQYYFARKPEYLLDGVVFYSVSVVLFLIMMRKPGAGITGLPKRGAGWSSPLIARMLLVVAGLALAALAVVQSGHLDQVLASGGSAWPVFWMWVVAMGLYVLAFLPFPDWAAHADPGNPAPAESSASKEDLTPTPPAVSQRVFGWLLARRWELSVVLLLLGAFVLRAWRIDTIPWTLGGDEGSQGLWARDVLEGRLPNMFGLGWLAVPNLSFYWQAAWLALVGDNIVGLRLPWAVAGVLTVLGTYLLVRRLFDRSLALLTAFLLATYHYHIHFSRLGSNQVADALFTVWALYLLVIGWKSASDQSDALQGSSRWAWGLSGIVAGLGFYFYAGSRQSLVILAAVLAWAALTERDFLEQQWRNLLVLFGGFLLSAGPIALVALRDPDNFNARLNQVGIFQSGWLQREVEITGRSARDLLAEQFRRAFLAYNLYRDRTSWYDPRTIPLMDFAASIFFVLGLAASVIRMIEWRYAMFVIWFVLVIVLGGALTESPPSSQRLISSAVPAVFFVAVAVTRLTAVLHDQLRWPQIGKRAAMACLAIALASISLRFYFGPYQASWTYGNANAEVATRIGYYLRDLGPGWEEYFFGAPRMYADFGSTPFIAKGVRLTDVPAPLDGPPTFVVSNPKPVFVFLPERLGELQWVKQAYPNGIEERVYRVELAATPTAELPLLFVAYRVQ